MSEDTSGLNPDVTMQQAALLQEAWRYQLDVWDGLIAETVRHGWGPEQARMLVFGTLIKNLGLS